MYFLKLLFYAISIQVALKWGLRSSLTKLKGGLKMQLKGFLKMT